MQRPDEQRGHWTRDQGPADWTLDPGPGSCSPDRLRQGTQRGLGHHHVTGEALLLRVLGDEPKVPAAEVSMSVSTSVSMSVSILTHLLCFGWQPQNEMFFRWKKWKHWSP